MSVFDVLGAAATIIQFIQYGVEFGNQVVAIYNNHSEMTELRKSIREYQLENDKFQRKIRLRAPDPSPDEALLNETAERCRQAAQDLMDILDPLVIQDDGKSKKAAVRIAFRIKRRGKDILAKQQQLEILRQKCHKQVSEIVR